MQREGQGWQEGGGQGRWQRQWRRGSMCSTMLLCPGPTLAPLSPPHTCTTFLPKPSVSVDGPPACSPHATATAPPTPPTVPTTRGRLAAGCCAPSRAAAGTMGFRAPKTPGIRAYMHGRVGRHMVRSACMVGQGVTWC